MKEIIVFGSMHWPDCEPLKELLSKHHISYEYVDITSSMPNLKHFLGYRDSKEEFNEIRKNKRVGLPAILIKDTEEIYFDLNEEILNKLK